MFKKFLIASLFLMANSIWAVGPTVECRFSAVDINGDVVREDIVAYTLNPATGISGNFDPYVYEISVFQNTFTIGLYLGDVPLSGAQIPVTNIVNLPLGATVFGINTIYHDAVATFSSLRYECRKILW